jgi:hypothetical protein
MDTRCEIQARQVDQFRLPTSGGQSARLGPSRHLTCRQLKFSPILSPGFDSFLTGCAYPFMVHGYSISSVTLLLLSAVSVFSPHSSYGFPLPAGQLNVSFVSELRESIDFSRVGYMHYGVLSLNGPRGYN